MRLLIGIWLATATALAFAQDNSLPGFRMPQPPTIDGTIDPAEWQGVPSGQGMFDEDTGQKADDNLQFWLAYDEKYIYFAAKVFDQDPGSIRATEYRTNVSLSGDDNVKLVLDLSGSLADFNEFGMNARGATEIELAGGRAAKREWSGEFVSKGRIVADGWEVEARIPWQIMRLPGTGPRTIRFNVQRELQRTQRDYIWQYTGGGKVEQHGRWIDVELPKAPVEHTLKLLPYAYGGYDRKTGHVANAGLDLKTNLTDQIVAVGSINPDFRNIENAILSLDFSRFERLAGETRPFFQEGNQYLNSALFASQRIPQFDLGVNVHGKLTDKLSFGVLDAVDIGERNNMVANFSYDPTPTDSYRVTTSSLTQPGSTNEAYLLRYNKRLGPVNVFLRNMGSKDTEEDKGQSNTLAIEYFKDGIFGYFGYDAVSPRFLPRLGFVPERDYKGITTGFELSRPLGKGVIRQVEAATYVSSLNHFDGGFYRRFLDSQFNVLLRNGLGLGTTLHLEDFEGTYDYLYGLNARMPRGNPYRYVFADYQWGRAEGDDYRSIQVGAAYRPIERLQLTASYQHVDHTERSDLGILGLNYDLGNDFYVSGRAVKRDGDWNAYLSLRRSGNRGPEYYLILGDPNARQFRASLILKVVWPLEIK